MLKIVKNIGQCSMLKQHYILKAKFGEQEMYAKIGPKALFGYFIYRIKFGK